jgi:hypothetical protein
VCLENEGHKVIAVSNSQEALAEASRRSFELVFVDLRLGTDDGWFISPNKWSFGVGSITGVSKLSASAKAIVMRIGLPMGNRYAVGSRLKTSSMGSRVWDWHQVTLIMGMKG